MELLDLFRELIREITKWLPSSSRKCLSLSSRKLYEWTNDPSVFGIHFMDECLRNGDYNIFKWGYEELGAPYLLTKHFSIPDSIENKNLLLYIIQSSAGFHDHFPTLKYINEVKSRKIKQLELDM